MASRLDEGPFASHSVGESRCLDGITVAIWKRPTVFVLPRPKDVTFVTRSTWHTCPSDPPTDVVPPVGRSVRCRLGSVWGYYFFYTHTKRFERWGRLFNRFLKSSSRRRVESKISRARFFFYMCVFFRLEPSDCCLTILYIKKRTHSPRRGWMCTLMVCDCIVLPFALYFSEHERCWRWDGDMGWAKRPGRFFRGLSTSPRIRINHEFSMMPNVLWAEYNF